LCFILNQKGLARWRELIGGSLGVSEILAQIDSEIAQLQQARALLAGTTVASKKTAATPEGRKRIAEAVKRRWAEQKKTASK
jgi:hypothetical protein